MEKKQDKGSCKQGKSRARIIGVNTAGGVGLNIGGLVVLGGTLAVTSLVAAFVVKKGSGRKNADKKDKQSNRGQRFVVDHQNQCCESKESPVQTDSCENLSLVDNPTSMTNGGNQNFTSDHSKGIVIVDDPKQEGINTSCDDCGGSEEFLTPVLDSRSLCEVAGKIENDPKDNKRWMERSEARRQEESEDAEKTVAEITPAEDSVDKEEEKEVEEEEEKKEGDSNEAYFLKEEAVGTENMTTEEIVRKEDKEEKVEKGDSYEEYAIEEEAVGAETLVPEKTKEQEQEEEDSNEDSVIEEDKVGAEKMVAEKTVGEETEDKEMEKGDTYEEYAVEEEAASAEMLAAEKTVEEEKEEEEQEEEGDTNEDYINEEEAVGAEKMVAEKAVEEKEKEEDEGDSNEEHFIGEEAVGAKNMVGEKAAEEEEDEGDINGKYWIEEEAVGAEKITAEKVEAMHLIEDEDEDNEEEEEDSNDGCEESSEGTGSASTESNSEAIWPAESLEALSWELKNTMINLQIPGEKIVEEDGSTKTKEFGDCNNSKSNILKNDLDHCKATENPIKFKEEEIPGLVQIIGQTADSTKKKFWIWTMLALALLLLLAFAHRSALSYHFVNPSSFLVHDEL